MGYCVSMEINVTFKKKSNNITREDVIAAMEELPESFDCSDLIKVLPSDIKAQAVALINEMHEPELMDKHGGKKMHSNYSWVDSPPAGGFKTLEEALKNWRYDYSDDYIYFTGEKLGDDNKLWGTLAPLIEEGSYIQCHGEDGFIWRWVFDGTGMKEIEPSW